MTNYSTATFKRDLDNLPVETTAEVISYILLAARLAGLPDGDGIAFLRWAELAEDRGDDFIPCLRGRLVDLAWAFDGHTGATLGAALAEAQDFALFQRLSHRYDRERYSRLIPEEIDSRISSVVRLAEMAPVDEEATEYLVKWLLLFPIREDWRLAVIASPLSDEMSQVAGDILRATAHFSGEKNKS